MDELSLLHKMRAETPPASNASIANGYQKLLTRTRATAPEAKVKRPWRVVRFGVASMAMIAVLATLVSADVVGLAGWRGAATAQAAQVLNDAAETTIQTSDPIVGPDQYLRIDSTNVWMTTSSDEFGNTRSWLDTETSSMYIPADRDGEWVWERSARVPTTFFDEETEAYALATQPTDEGTVLRGEGGGFYGPPSEGVAPSEDYLNSMPRDPHQLLNRIYKKTIGQGQSVDGQALVFIADLLRTGLVPADLRAALYKAAALIPGVTITEEQANLAGRTGVAIGRVEESSNIRQDIIIDTRTGLLIGEREVTLEPLDGIPAGTAITLTSIETSVSDIAP